MSNISIIDDFLDLHEFNEIQDLMLGRWFPWYYNDFVNRDYDSLEKDNPNTFQFTHVFYGDDAPQSSFFQSLQPYIIKIKPKSLIRVKANLLTKTNIIVKHGYHIDQPFDCKTAIAYINTNNGYTRFETGEEISSVENRLVIFDSRIEHSGTTCTNQKCRVVINFNYF